MPSIRTRVVAVAATLTATLAAGSAADAHAAVYYNIVNKQTGRALQAVTPDSVKLAPRDPSNLLQQWTRLHVSLAGDQQFHAILRNRLLKCLSTPSFGPNPHLIARAKLGECDSSEGRSRWLHKWGDATPTPSLSGLQLKNAQSGEYLGEEFCIFVCVGPPLATVQDAQLVETYPLDTELGTKWEFKFAASAPVT